MYMYMYIYMYMYMYIYIHRYIHILLYCIRLFWCIITHYPTLICIIMYQYLLAITSHYIALPNDVLYHNLFYININIYWVILITRFPSWWSLINFSKPNETERNRSWNRTNETEELNGQVLRPNATVVLNLLVGMTGSGSSGSAQEIEEMVTAIATQLGLGAFLVFFLSGEQWRLNPQKMRVSQWVIGM